MAFSLFLFHYPHFTVVLPDQAIKEFKNPPKSAIYEHIMTILYSDTGRKAERVQIELLRRAPTWRKIQMVAQLNEIVGTLALSSLRQRHPDASPQVLRRLLADLMLGESLAEKVYGPIQKHSEVAMANEPFQATTLAMNALDQLQVPMSLAALEHAKPLTDRLSGTFYADVEIIKDAVEHHN